MFSVPLCAKRQRDKAPCKLQPCRRSSPQRCEFERARHHKHCAGCLRFFTGLQVLSLSGNRLSFLPEKIFAPLDSLQLLDLGRLGLQHVGSDTFPGLVTLEKIVPQPKSLEIVASRLIAAHAGSGEIIPAAQLAW